MKGDQGATLTTLSVGVQTLQSFVDDCASQVFLFGAHNDITTSLFVATRLSSLLEVPEAEAILLKTITLVVRHTSIKLSQKSKETLVRLFARASAAIEQGSGDFRFPFRFRPAPKGIPTTWGPRITPAQVYQWGSEVRKTHRDDLFRVIQPFGSSSTRYCGRGDINHPDHCTQLLLQDGYLKAVSAMSLS